MTKVCKLQAASPSLVQTVPLALCLCTGGELGEGDHPHEVPGVATLRILPAAHGGQSPPPSGHPGGEALCHCGEHRSDHRRVCPQHCSLPEADQPHGEVSEGVGESMVE